MARVHPPQGGLSRWPVCIPRPKGWTLLRTWKCRLVMTRGWQREEGQQPPGEMGWACLRHSQLPTLREQEAGLVPISRPLKGFLSAPECFILCVQDVHHTTISVPSRGEEPGFPPGGLLPRRRTNGRRCPPGSCQLGLTGPPKGQLTRQLPAQTEGTTMGPPSRTLPSCTTGQPAPFSPWCLCPSRPSRSSSSLQPERTFQSTDSLPTDTPSGAPTALWTMPGFPASRPLPATACPAH